MIMQLITLWIRACQEDAIERQHQEHLRQMIREMMNP